MDAVDAMGGGLAGHNGLKSISQHMGTNDYMRVRIGVGKPSNKEQGADHVLSSIPAAERKILDVAVETAVEVASVETKPVVVSPLSEGGDSASNVESVDVEDSPAITTEGRADSTSDEVA